MSNVTEHKVPATRTVLQDQHLMRNILKFLHGTNVVRTQRTSKTFRDATEPHTQRYFWGHITGQNGMLRQKEEDRMFSHRIPRPPALTQQEYKSRWQVHTQDRKQFQVLSNNPFTSMQNLGLRVAGYNTLTIYDNNPFVPRSSRNILILSRQANNYFFTIGLIQGLLQKDTGQDILTPYELRHFEVYLREFLRLDPSPRKNLYSYLSMLQLRKDGKLRSDLNLRVLVKVRNGLTQLKAMSRDSLFNQWADDQLGRLDSDIEHRTKLNQNKLLFTHNK